METSISPAARRLAVFGSFALIGTSAALGAAFAYRTGSETHIALGVALAFAAVGGKAIEPVSVSRALEALRMREFGQAAACVILALICCTYSVTAELSLIAETRGGVSAKREAAAENRQALRDERQRAVAELSTLPAARTPAEIAPLISDQRRRIGSADCGRKQGWTVTQACGAVLELEAESARATRRAELNEIIRAADVALRETTGSAKDADPLAATLAGFGQAAGIEIRAEQLVPFLTLPLLLMLEIGSALALVTLRTMPAPSQPDRTPIAGPPVSAEQAPDTRPLHTPPPTLPPAGGLPVAASDTVRPLVRPKDSAAARGVMNFLEAQDGSVRAGVRTLAKAIGVSKTHLHSTLRALADEGRIILEAGPDGTTVALA